MRLTFSYSPATAVQAFSLGAQFARESVMLKLPEERIKDGGYNNITNLNKVLPTQNTPALQAIF